MSQGEADLRALGYAYALEAQGMGLVEVVTWPSRAAVAAACEALGLPTAHVLAPSVRELQARWRSSKKAITKWMNIISDVHARRAGLVSAVAPRPAPRRAGPDRRVAHPSSWLTIVPIDVVLNICDILLRHGEDVKSPINLLSTCRTLLGGKYIDANLARAGAAALHCHASAARLAAPVWAAAAPRGPRTRLDASAEASVGGSPSATPHETPPDQPTRLATNVDVLLHAALAEHSVHGAALAARLAALGERAHLGACLVGMGRAWPHAGALVAASADTLVHVGADRLGVHVVPVAGLLADSDDKPAQPSLALAPAQWLTGVPIAHLALGGGHALAVTDEGDLFGWGASASGQLGATAARIAAPTRVPLPGGARCAHAAVGDTFTVALSTSADLFVLGQLDPVQLRTCRPHGRAPPPCPEPRPLALPSGVFPLAVAAGKMHAAVLGSDGLVYTLGAGSFGALGQGDLRDSAALAPVRYAGDARVVARHVSAGDDHTVVTAADGAVYVCGGGPGRAGHPYGLCGAHSRQAIPGTGQWAVYTAVRVNLPDGAAGVVATVAGPAHTIARHVGGRLSASGPEGFWPAGDAAGPSASLGLALLPEAPDAEAASGYAVCADRVFALRGGQLSYAW